MAILIKDMEMPYCCTDCRFMADGWCYAISADDKQPAEARTKRPDWCPLIDVPPHGRLIDADAFLLELTHWKGTDGNYYENRQASYTLDEVIDAVEKAEVEEDGGANK